LQRDKIAGKPSTIIKLSNDAQVKVIRKIEFNRKCAKFILFMEEYIYKEIYQIVGVLFDSQKFRKRVF
jgi:hypothetical protein